MGTDYYPQTLIGVRLAEISAKEADETIRIPQYDSKTGERLSDREKLVEAVEVFGQRFVLDDGYPPEELTNEFESRGLLFFPGYRGVLWFNEAYVGVLLAGTNESEQPLSNNSRMCNPKPATFDDTIRLWTEAQQKLMALGVQAHRIKAYTLVYICS
jgi:hypothetical protein